jgi:glycosyltransferase involved in cell wall biosynthesis
MMACRCAAVELASARWEGVLTHGQDAWLVEAKAEAIADGVVQLLDNNALRDRIIENAWEKTRSMSWRNSVRQIESVLLRST